MGDLPTNNGLKAATTHPCPAWCRTDHTRDGHVHRAEVGRADVGADVSGERVPVVLLQVPAGEPTVTISGGLYVAVQPDDADDMARLMTMAGQCGMADLIRRAAAILQSDDQGEGDVASATVPGTWPGGEPTKVRAAADDEDDGRDPCVAEQIDGNWAYEDCGCVDCRTRLAEDGGGVA